MSKPARPVLTVPDLLRLARDRQPLPVVDSPEGPLCAIVAPFLTGDSGLGGFLGRDRATIRAWLLRLGPHVARPSTKTPMLDPATALDLLGELRAEPVVHEGAVRYVIHAPGCTCVIGRGDRFRDRCVEVSLSRSAEGDDPWWSAHIDGARALLAAAAAHEPETLLQHELTAFLGRESAEGFGQFASAYARCPGLLNTRADLGPNSRCWPWEGHVPTLRAWIRGEPWDAQALDAWALRRTELAMLEGAA
jgi:hypothetical protein